MKRTSENACIYNPCDILNEDVLMNILGYCAYKDLQQCVRVRQLWKIVSIKIYKDCCDSDLENFIETLRVKLIKPEKFLKKVGFFDKEITKNFFSKCDSLNRLFYLRVQVRENFIGKLSECFNNYLYEDFWKKTWNWENFNETEDLFGINIDILEFYKFLNNPAILKESIAKKMSKMEIYYDKEHDDDINCKRVYELMNNYLFDKAIHEVDGNECDEAKYSCLEKLSYNLCNRGLNDVESIINAKKKDVIDNMHFAVAEKYVKLGADEKKFKRYNEAIDLYKLGLSIIKNLGKTYKTTNLIKTAYEGLFSVYTTLGEHEKAKKIENKCKKHMEKCSSGSVCNKS